MYLQEDKELKVFLSWSGEVSRQVALVFRDWLPSVLQSVTPYVSSEDIDKGTRWSSDIASELNDSHYGIIVVTKENIKAPWINFEAGALSKHIDKSHVSPFLFNLKRSEVDGPLLQFQSTIYSKEDIKKLVESINSSLGEEALEQIRLDKVFEVWWMELKNSLDILQQVEESVESTSVSEANIFPSSEILEEILDLVRNQQKILRSPTDLLPPDYLNQAIRIGRRNNAIDPKALVELDQHIFYLLSLVRKNIDNTEGHEYLNDMERTILDIQHIFRYVESKVIDKKLGTRNFDIESKNIRL